MADRVARQRLAAVRCDLCGEPIGVYEPLVVVVDGAARATSRAAEPALESDEGGAHYHEACYAELDSPPECA